MDSDVMKFSEKDATLFDAIQRESKTYVDILDQLENEKQLDQTMMDQHCDAQHVPFVGEEYNSARPLNIEEMLEHFGSTISEFSNLRARLEGRNASRFCVHYGPRHEKEMEDKMAAAIEHHRIQLFSILSEFREGVGCAFEQSVPDTANGDDGDIGVNNGLETLNHIYVEDESFQNASFSSGYAGDSGYVESSPKQIELSIDRQLLVVVSNSFKILRQLESFY